VNEMSGFTEICRPEHVVRCRRDSGELTYVNAGHNAPIVGSSGSTTSLEATGPPLGKRRKNSSRERDSNFCSLL